jgi:serine/threonine protein kinase
MELLGPSLSHARRAAAGSVLRLGEAVAATRGALAALQRMHAAGFVHRDVKPSNILFARSGCAGGAGAGEGRGRVVLIDFGLARLHVGADGRVVAER